MADVINLNKARKLRDRKRHALDAAEQRIRHGRSKQQKQLEASVAAALQRSLTAFAAGLTRPWTNEPGATRLARVPEVYGYLSLDERGQWLIRGEPISRTSLVEHLQRHYQCDDGGRWFVKNGWQQAFVTLAYLPWVLRVTGAGELINHCQRPVASIKGAAIDEYGALALLTDAGPGLVDSRDLEWALARLSAGDSPVADDDLDDALKVTSGALTELSFRAVRHPVTGPPS